LALLLDIIRVSWLDCVPKDGLLEGLAERVVGVEAFVVHSDYAIND
jgi:hypothetical protein